MHKLFAGAAAAALLTVGAAGMASAQDLVVGPGSALFPTGTADVIGGNAFVFNPPANGGTGFLVSVEGAPSSFLIAADSGLSVDFGVGGLTGASLVTPGGEIVNAPGS
jgi:hypothetical protein